MKKFEFTFVCHKDPAKMPEGDKTRFCGKCQNHIHDFRKMHTAQIANTIKASNTHCGIMHPWQIDELNEFLESTHPVQQPKQNLNNFVKAAAILSSPLLVTQASAQTKEPTFETTHVDPTQNPVIEIEVTGKHKTVLTDLAFKVYHASVLVDSVTTDGNGKIIFDHGRYKNARTLVLKNETFGLEKTISLQENICIRWKTDLSQSKIINGPKEVYDVQFLFSQSGKERPVKSSHVTIELFDNNNEVIDTYKNETNGAGYAILKTNKLNKATTVVFTVKTRKGEKTIHKNVSEISNTDVTKLTIYTYKRKRHHYRRQLLGAYSF
ncbi:MAG TPA: hypothetical protein VK177_18785 [Flavobacteriales bacterium]|nr:hypothetical protein [Flavobacteriales bacterium]